MTTTPAGASPVTARTITVDLGEGEPLTVEVHEPADPEAAARTVLLLHGGAGPRSVSGFGVLLAERMGARVLVPTHPGFSGTSRPQRLDSARTLAAAYVAVLEQLELDGVTVIGSSFGGWVAAEIALLASPRVRAAVIVDGIGALVPGHPVTDVSALTPAEIVALSWHDPSRAPVLATPPAGVPGSGAAPATPSPDILALLAYAGRDMADPTLLGRLAGATTPVHVVWGESDRIVDVDHGRALADATPDATFTLIPRAGHLPQLEAPEALLDAIAPLP